jgi:hypothetical protein
MLQPNAINFSDLGIVQPINLIGSVTIINKGDSSPIVFLLDEKHDDIDCINKNITNALELLSKAKVELIGVESLAGGVEWSEETCNYVQNDYNDKWYAEGLEKYRNDHTEFLDELFKEYSSLIVGVESIGMMNKIEVDFYNANLSGKVEVAHPLHRERSRHFIETLFDIYRIRQLSGNLILNCGRHHNDDIEEWIKSGEIEEFLGIKATYVRINNSINERSRNKSRTH